ncbi:DUF192 domain-containing protein [Paenibacillus sp.]|uniref:DUF192 domain-containing protein n=1 Tax=Paenibacillus sp. TaxID=58172 RepID=UPI002D6F553E|nr:DUF192 domain-containing protein [Paenibacillus sp.]HZG58207.1 DUF192 domain-containing protein [Paenibacillus sp.]
MLQLRKKVIRLDSFWSRFAGLMLRAGLPKDVAVLIAPCKAVHTWFMRFPIAVIYLDKESHIVWFGVLTPWRIGPYIKQAAAVLETSDTGICERLAVGEQLHFGTYSTNAT